MKKFKKLLAVMLAAIMVMAMGTNVFAADDCSIKITGVQSNTHTFKAYQIFSGTISANGTTLSNITWGSGLTITDESELLGKIKAITADNTNYPFSAVTSAADVAGVLSNYSDNDTIVQLFADVISGYVSATPSGSTNTGVSNGSTYDYTIGSLEAGYYLVTDTDSAAIDNVVSDYIIKLVSGTAEIATKGYYPTVDKTVKNSTDSTASETTTAQIGETLTFTLTVDVPNISAYSANGYKLVITDTMSDGLAYTSDSLSVSVTATKSGESTTSTLTPSASSDYTLVTPTTGSNVITITFSNLYKYLNDNDIDFTKDITITVTYNAVLDSDAVIGGSGNTNTVKLTYSNNPNWDGTTGSEPTSDTPEETVTVFSLKIKVTKVDSSNTDKTLEGAKFKIYYEDGTTKYYAVLATGSSTKIASWTTDETAASEFTSADSTGLFTVEGLGVGTYYLVETAAPDGYNLPTGDDAITTIVVTSSNITYNAAGTAIETLSATVTPASGTTTATGTGSTGEIAFKITNSAGSTIPSTGGMGTTILYIIGTILVIGAAVILVTRRRMANK